MKPIYCAETMERIPPEYFAQGRAIWSGGKPYLRDAATKKGLQPDAAPPAEFLAQFATLAPPPGPMRGVVIRPRIIYCTETLERIPAEYFEQGKAVWSSGKPYLKTVADRLGLKADPFVPASEPPPLLPPTTPVSATATSVAPEPPAQVAPSPASPPATPPDSAPFPTDVPQVPVLGQDSPKPSSIPDSAIPSTVLPVKTNLRDRFEPGQRDPASVTTLQGTVLPLGVFQDTFGAAAAAPKAAEKAKPTTALESPKEPPVLHAPDRATEEKKSPAPGPVTAAAPQAATPPPVLTTPASKAPTPPATTPAAAAAAPASAAPAPVPPATVAPAKEKGSDAAPKVAATETPASPAKAAATPKAEETPKPASPSSPASKPKPEAPAKPAEPAEKPAAPEAAAKKAAEPEKAAPPADEKIIVAKAPPPREPKIVANLEQGTPLSAAELAKIPIFDGIPRPQIERLFGAVVRREYKKGEIICREGDQGSTAFYILEGHVDIFLRSPVKRLESVKKEGSRSGLFGIFRRFQHVLVGRKEFSEGERPGRFIPIDATVDLALDNPVATLGPKDLFGEMTCLSLQPRSATVRAAEDCVMLEMLRNVLQVLQRNRAFKAQLERLYKDRALAQHLRSVSILKDLSDEFIDRLRERVSLVDYQPGESIVKQGDPADAFYLIRIGCVKVTQRHVSSEMVLTYLSRGDYFGEMGILKGGKRTATCTALDHVELVRIARQDFEFMLGWFPGLREQFEKEALRREKHADRMARRAPTVPLDEFLAHGLMHAQSLLLLDLERCTRCDECVRACADSHDGISRLVREGLRFDKYLVPTSCRGCMDPVCMIGCPVGSIRRKESLEIIIEDWCIGCRKCAQQCPYGNITMHPIGSSSSDDGGGEALKAEVKLKAVTCDLCSDLSEPSCVYACPHDAAQRVNAREYFLGQRDDDVQ